MYKLNDAFLGFIQVKVIGFGELNSMSMIKKLISNKIKGRSFLKSVMLVAGGTAAAQIIMFTISPVLSRLFSPEDFGIVSVYTAILFTITPFCTLKFELAIPLEEDEIGAFHLLFISMMSVLITAAITFLVFFFAGNSLLALFNAESLSPNFWLISIGVISTGSYSVLFRWAQREKNYSGISKTKVRQGLGKAITQICLGLLKTNSFGLVFGEIIGQSMGIGMLAKPLLRKRRYLKRSLSIKKTRKLIIRYKKFPLISTWSDLLNAASIQIPIIMLSTFFGTQATGFFAFAQRIVFVPISLIATSIAQVYFSEGAELSKSDSRGLLKLTSNISKKLLLLGIFIALFLVFFAPSLFEVIFGKIWKQAGVYCQILSIVLLSRLLVEPILPIFTILEKQGTQLVLDATKLLIGIVVFLISHFAKLSPTIAIMLYSVSTSCLYIATILLIKRFIKLITEN